MIAVMTPAEFNDYKGADISLAACGRRATIIPESEIPALLGHRHTYASDHA
ncbi:adenosylhomocysteinase, partial [Pseudomonas syringae]